MSSEKIVLSRRPSGTSPRTIRWARPSTIAVLPTPGSPISTGLFFVLRRQDLDHPADLGVPADHRVELACPRLGDQVPAVLLQRLVGPLRGRRGDPLVAADLGQRRQEGVPGDPVTGAGRRPAAVADPSSARAITRCSTETYSSLSRFASRSAASSSRASRWVTIHLTGGRAGAADLRPAGQFTLQIGAERVEVRAGLFEQPGHQPVRLVEQGEQQVLAVDLGVADGATFWASCSASLGLLGQAGSCPCGCPPSVGPLLRACSMRSSRSSTSPMAA